MIVLYGGEKGGTGKTTLATNTAACMANRGSDVILVDADPQGTASRWKDRRDVFIQNNPGLSIGTVHGIRKTDDLIATLKDLATRYQHVIVDVGGKDTKEFRSALVVADIFYSPLLPSLPDMETLLHVNELVGQAKATINPNLQASLLISKAPSNPFNREAQEAREALDAFDQFTVSPVEIKERVVFRKAFFDGLGVADGDSVARYNNNEAKAEIQLLADEIFGTESV